LKKALETYGGEEHLQVPESIKDEGESEVYVEYNPNGKIKKNVVKNVTKSVYPEDININGHKSVWGSFYHNYFGWGYKCCHSFEKNSYCKGVEGKRENNKKMDEYEKQKKDEEEKEKEKTRQKSESEEVTIGTEALFTNFFERAEKYEANKGAKKEVKEVKEEDTSMLKKKREEPINNTFQRDITKEIKEFDPKKIGAAIGKEQERRNRDSEMLKNERIKKKDKSAYLSKEEDVVTAEDMEAYKLMRIHHDDPMNNMK